MGNALTMPSPTVEIEAANGVEGDSFSASGQSCFLPPDRPKSKHQRGSKTNTAAIMNVSSSAMNAAKDANVMGKIQLVKSKTIKAGTHTSDRVVIQVRKPRHAPHLIPANDRVNLE